jgi:ribosomal protein S12 methylthiotransferase
MKYYYIVSLGCSKNLVDSEIFATILEKAGYHPWDDNESIDLVLVNTCSFIEPALEELEKVLSELVEMKKEGEIKQLIVTGCLMNRGLEKFRKAYSEVDNWIELKDFATLEEWLGLTPQVKYQRTSIDDVYYRYLRISDGCSNHCTYCTIPSIRGEMKSVPIETLVEEAQELAHEGNKLYSELIVIAQDTSNYGIDLYGHKLLPELLEELINLNVYQWIRVLYMHPDHFETSWLELWEKHPELIPYFEIPIQHSSDSILKAMGRRKGSTELKEMFYEIKRRIPQAVFRTTLMVGFPGESRQDFESLKSFISSIPFLYPVIFPYYREEGTVAAEMENQVSNRIIQRRYNQLIDLQQQTIEEILLSYVGKTVDLLIEENTDEVEGADYIGRTWFQTPDIDGITFVKGNNLELGKIYPVRLIDTEGTDLFGEIIKEGEK